MPAIQLCVAPWGDDSGPGTAQRPFATLDRAQRAVRASTDGMDADVVVSLRAGTYVRTAPFELVDAAGDSGQNGRQVVYQAHGYGTAEQEEVVISGGRVVPGWRPDDAASGVWRAEVGALETRQLFVDGRRAERAALTDGVPGTLTRTDTGYVTDSAAPQLWASPGDIEFVYQGVYPWSEARCGVADIAGDERSTTITMAQPAFGWAVQLYNAVISWETDGPARSGLGGPTAVENSPSFLTQPGTFALDRSRPGRHVLYYLPREVVDLSDAHVVVPALETLVLGRGTADAPLRDVTLRGITFADATWLRPSEPGGFLHYHGGTYYDGGPIETVTFAEGQGSVTVPAGEPATIPGNVVFVDTAGITIEGNRFTRLGADALQFSGGGAGNTVRGNVFDDISGGAISVNDASTGMHIGNNWIHHIGRDYRGSPAICLTGGQDATIVHNQINDVPHCGIVVNGGDSARGTRLLHNLVFNTMTVLADGGGHDDPPEGVTVEGNTRLPQAAFDAGLAGYPAAAAIVANAGIEPTTTHPTPRS